MSGLVDQARIVANYLAARRGGRFGSRAALERHQQRMIRRFVRRTLVLSPFYRPYLDQPLAELPIMSKSLMLEHFDGINTRGIRRDHAFALAERAEATRDFAPMIGDVSVGLSTGTSGRRGLFLASRAERMRWAGIMLGRMLPGSLLGPHRIAFLLRANNNLYESVAGHGRIDFRFFDLAQPLAQHHAALRSFRPTVLIAPAQVLRLLARMEGGGDRRIAPQRIISVAEVLFDDDRALIERVLGRRVDQVYQCTEGFLGYTCAAGRLHLNETFLHVEPEWLDEAATRFLPIVTDFSRDTQPIVRFRLDDVLTIDRSPCPCGSHERVIARVEGRADDILVLPRRSDGRAAHLMPDFVARALAGAADTITDFRVEQLAVQRLCIALAADDFERARKGADVAMRRLLDGYGLVVPDMTFAPLAPADLMSKRRRVRRDRSIAL